MCQKTNFCNAKNKKKAKLQILIDEVFEGCGGRARENKSTTLAEEGIFQSFFGKKSNLTDLCKLDRTSRKQTIIVAERSFDDISLERTEHD